MSRVFSAPARLRVEKILATCRADNLPAARGTSADRLAMIGRWSADRRHGPGPQGLAVSKAAVHVVGLPRLWIESEDHRGQLDTRLRALQHAPIRGYPVPHGSEVP